MTVLNQALKVTPQLLRFALVGVAATLINALVYLFLALSGTTSPLFANLAGFVVAASAAYWGHKRWTFQDRHQRGPSSLIKFVVASLLGLACNSGWTWLLVEHIGWPKPSALIGILAVTPALTFLVNKYWVFTPQQANDERLE